MSASQSRRRGVVLSALSALSALQSRRRGAVHSILSVLPVLSVLSVLSVLLAFTTPLYGQGGGNGTIYYGNYGRSILVIDEATMRVRDTIPVSVGIPLVMGMSEDRRHLYVSDPQFEHMEILDLTTRRPVDQFTLSGGNRHVLIDGFSVEPREQYAIMVLRTITKQTDRFQIDKPVLVRFDLATKQVTDTIPWPGGREQGGIRVLFSPDGGLLYFLMDDVLVYDAATLKQVDKWPIGSALDNGMGQFNFGFQRDFYEEPGYYRGVFRITDPINHRTQMGVARVNLAERSVETYTFGPTAQVNFVMSPDRKRAYGLHQEVNNWEFWTFDLENRRVLSKVPFNGRPRMRLSVSSNGQQLYISGAGPTIEIRDARTFRVIRTVDVGADITSMIHVPPER